MKPRVHATVFSALAAEMSKTLGSNTARATRERRFKKIFGVSALICAKVWEAVVPHLPCSASPVHLLWTLYFLKHYGLVEVNAAFAKCDEKTYRKWCWKTINALAELELMDWEKRYEKDNGSQCLVSVDGTDFAIQEPSPFSPKWFSHKFKGAGVRYEVAICIQTGEPVWINGPFPCGSWNDLRIARSALVDALDPGEYYLADGGYRDGNQWSVTPSGHHRFDDRQKSVVRARHETYNKRLKDWGH